MKFKERTRLNVRALIHEAFSEDSIYDDSKNAYHFAAEGFKYKSNEDANLFLKSLYGGVYVDAPDARDASLKAGDNSGATEFESDIVGNT